VGSSTIFIHMKQASKEGGFWSSHFLLQHSPVRWIEHYQIKRNLLLLPVIMFSLFYFLLLTDLHVKVL